MINRIVFISILVLSFLNLEAQNKPTFSLENIPQAILDQADGIVLYDLGTFDVKSPSKAIASYKLAIIRQNDNAPSGELYIPYNDYKKIKNIKVKWYGKKGNLLKVLEKDDIKDISLIDGNTLYTDYRAKYIDLEMSQYPYTVDYSYEVHYEEIMSYPSWYFQEENKYILHSEYQLIHSNNMDVQHRVFNADPEYIVKHQDNKIFKTWKAEQLPPLDIEPYSPVRENILPVIHFAPESFQVEKYTGSMKSWKAFGQFIYKLNGNHNNLSEAMKSQVGQITANATTQREKVELLYKYLQENYRYVSIQIGIGGWKSFDARFVEEHKYGDCKALTWFMKSMLEEVGIHSIPALVNAGASNKGVLYDANFSYPEFNHVILHVPEVDMWLECTSTNAPLGYLGSFTEGRTVLMISENGGELYRTPFLLYKDNLSIQIKSINLLSDGSAILKINVENSGVTQEYYRHLIDMNNIEAYKAYVSRRLDVNDVNWLDVIINKNTDEPIVSTFNSMEVKRYAKKSGTRLFVPLIGDRSGIKVPQEIENRIQPIVLETGFIQIDTISVSFPEGYRLENNPQDYISDTEFGKYSLVFHAKEDEVICIRSFSFNPFEMPADNFNAFRQFLYGVRKADRGKIVLVKNKKEFSHINIDPRK